MTKDNKTYKLTTAALFAALCCIATMIIQIPTPTNGYINLGDCFVLLSGWLLGPLYGGVAAGIGSMLADILSGYSYYAPATFIIKGFMAVIAYCLAILLSRNKSKNLLTLFISAFVSEIIMVVGYFIFAALFLGTGVGAIAGIPGNIVQGGVSLIISILLFKMIQKTRLIP